MNEIKLFTIGFTKKTAEAFFTRLTLMDIVAVPSRYEGFGLTLFVIQICSRVVVYRKGSAMCG